MKAKTIFLIIISVIILLVVILLTSNYLNGQFANRQTPADINSINSYEECVRAGYPIMESYPGQCRVTETDKTFTEVIGARAEPPSPTTISSFEECARAGYMVGESNPRQCWTPDGKHFVEDIVKGALPPPGPITISGSITCLSKKGSGPQTMECAIGLKGLDGRDYGLKNLFQHDPEYKFSAGGIYVEVSGVFTPGATMAPGGNQYDVAGTIDVTSIKKL